MADQDYFCHMLYVVMVLRMVHQNWASVPYFVFYLAMLYMFGTEEVLRAVAKF